MRIRGSRSVTENADSCLPCTPEEEKRIINELIEAAESNLKEGNLYYLVANRWWRDWQEYIREDQSSCSIDELAGSSYQSNGYISNVQQRPGQIDNSDLLLNGVEGEGDELELRTTLEEGHDYVLVPQEVWKKLHEWYSGGPAIPRKLICGDGFVRKEFSVEVYPLSLQLIDARDDHQSIIRISRKASISELYNKVCTSLKLEQEKVRIWDYFEKRKHALLGDFRRTLEEAQLQMNQHILLEVEVDGFWSVGLDSTDNELALVPIEPSRSSTTIAGGPSLSNGYSTRFSTDLINGGVLNPVMGDTEDGREPVNMSIKRDGGGLAGLQNLGNTCFMNSALQCLVHTPPLVEYFLQDYSEEINRSNPLGLKGELAIAFGDLLRKLWLPGRIPIAPRAFKGKLARFAPQFSGYNQHDSQELLAFLLDGLHEDLNRVKDKPYIEAKDANGRPDEEFADECWRNHRARNDSIIVDVCQGQYKSTLVCPICSKVSVTFDPFMYLSLPLPPTAKRTMTVTVFYGDGSSLPMPFTVDVPKHGCYRDLTQALSSECCLSSDESMLLAEVYAHRIHQYLDNPFEPLSRIKDEDHIVAYRLPANHEKLLRLEILHGKRQRRTSDLQNGGYQELLGTPLVTCLGEGVLTGADIEAALRSVLAPLLRKKEYRPQNHSKSCKENGCSAVADSGSNIENHDPCTSPNMEIEHSPSENLSFHIWLTDARALNRNPIESSTHIRPDAIIRVLLDWSDEEFDLFDFSFLENLPEVLKSGFTMKKTRQEAISLFSCLEAFLKEEPLGPDDMWYCPSCKEHRQATKKLDLWKLPEILVVHLKRFFYSRYMKNKLDTFVNFPINNLDLSKYVKHKDGAGQSHVYELYAVSNHYGGLGGGHYSAYAKLIHENRWYHFDDSNVSAVGDESIKTSAAYVLFYRRVKVEAG